MLRVLKYIALMAIPRPVDEAPPLRALRGEVVTKEEEIVLIPTRGETRTREVSAAPVRNVNGAIIGSVSVVRDITERKLVEEALRGSEERFRLVLQASSMGTFEVDLLTGEGKWNATEFELLGLRPGEVMASPDAFFRFVHPDDVEQLQDAWTEAMRSGRLDAEFRIVRADGQERWLAGKGQFFSDGKPGGNDSGTSGESLRFMGVNFDITERKVAEEALRESDAKFRALFDHSADAVFMTIPDGRVTAANQTACEMFGFSEEEFCQVARAGISDPEDPRHAAAVAERARTGKIRAELSYVRKDGTKFTGEVSSVIVGGKGLQSFVSVRDITERKQAEEALRESEKKFRTLFEHAYDAIIVTDPTGGGGIISANPAACNMFGYSEEEFLNIDLAREAIVDTSDPNLATFLKDRDEKGWAASELTYKRKDGTCFVGDVSSAFYTDRSGNRLAVAMIRDITERKRSEAEIARLASFPMLNPNPFIEVDLAGVIHFCNPAAEKMFPDFLQREREHPLLADWETVVRSVCEGGLKESIRELEIEGRWYQEALHFVEETKRIHIYGRDITLRKEAEKETMERAEQLEEVNKDLESFGFSIAHDLRAPLRAITGYSQMILKKQGERFDEETRRRFQMITDNAEAMGRLIDDLLAFSRLGSQAVAKTSLDMEKLAGEVWQELRNINPGREMTLKISPTPTTCGDRALIRQVYSNLLGNAVKFTQERDMAMIEVGSCVRNCETVYYIRDNGVGFDMRFYDKLFGVFQRLHSDEEYKGTGIGLALVKRIINRHGGRIWAEGKVDGGATFYFTLPQK